MYVQEDMHSVIAVTLGQTSRECNKEMAWLLWIFKACNLAV